MRAGPGRPPRRDRGRPGRLVGGAAAAIAEAAGGLDDVAAVGVGGPAARHGLPRRRPARWSARPCSGTTPARPAAAADLVAELGGARAWAEAVGSCRWPRSPSPSCAGWPTTSRTSAARVAAVCLPHDWLTWRLAGAAGLDALATDRGDASGTGYWSPADRRLPARPARARPRARRRGCPAVLGPAAAAGRDAPAGPVLGPGHRRQHGGRPRPRRPARRRGRLDRHLGHRVRRRRAARPPTPSGIVAGFADATGRFLPLVCTLNAARVLDAAAGLLGVDHERLSELALERPGRRRRADPGALPGGRAHPEPARRHRGRCTGCRLGNATPAHLARAAVEGLLCGLADGLDALVAEGVDGRAGAAGRRRRPLRGACAGSPRPCSAARWWSRRRPSTSPTAPPARPPGPWPAAPSRPAGSWPGTEHLRGRPGPRRSASGTPPAATSPSTRQSETTTQPVGYYCRRPVDDPGRGGGVDMTERWRAPPAPSGGGSRIDRKDRSCVDGSST